MWKDKISEKWNFFTELEEPVDEKKTKLSQRFFVTWSSNTFLSETTQYSFNLLNTLNDSFQV